MANKKDNTNTPENKETQNENLNTEPRCVICGRPKSKVPFMYRSDHKSGGCVCSDCIETAHQFTVAHMADIGGKLKASEEEDCKVDFNPTIPTPHEIKEYLDQYVIGQDDAKITLAVAVYNHYKRITQKKSDNEDDNVEIDKSNILLCGQTGSGKTLLARTIAKLLDVPFAIADATVFTEAGYVGEDVESMLTRLLQACDYDVKKAEMGIVLLDEADKLGRKSDNPSITRDVNGEGVQQALLKMLEGTDVLVPPQGGRKHPDAKMISINTKNILFICSGAFVGIEDVIGQRLNTRSIGFDTTPQDESSKIDKENLIRYIEPIDLKRFGFIPEIIGRLPVITYVEKLDKTALKRILVEPKNAIIKQYKKLFEIDNVKLTFTDNAYDSIVQEAISTNTGARGLKNIVERILKRYMYDIPTEHPQEVVIDKIA